MNKSSWCRLVHASRVVALASVVACLPVLQATAAVPVEERDGSDADEAPAQSEAGVQSQAGSENVRSQPLNIPPTIESTQNTDFPPPGQSQPTQSRQNVSAAQTTDSSQLSELFYQMQVLQQEIQQMRGQIEEQEFLIRRLQRDQTEKYADIDRRLSGSGGSASAPSNSVSNAGTAAIDAPPPSSNNTSGTPTTPRSASNAPPRGGFSTEREAYTFAFEEMRSRRFNESIAGFEQLIVEYPNGQYTPNAYYWLGELHLAQTETEQARQSFMQVVNLYPDHQKVPDAMYKLGVVYDNLGDQVTSQQFLDRVQAEHPQSSAAGLAAKYVQAVQ